MDARQTDQQLALRAVARAIVADHAASTVQELGDRDRALRMRSLLTDAGLYELRSSAALDDGATSVDLAVVAEELSRGAAEVPYLGPMLASDLVRQSDVDPSRVPAPTTTVAMAPDLRSLAVLGEAELAVAVDAVDGGSALALAPTPDGWELALVPLTRSRQAPDLTSGVGTARLDGPHEIIGSFDGDITRWRSFALAMSAADLVGSAIGAHEMSVDYAMQREQYGRPVGSFQAVQHLIADSLVLLEGAVSASRYAAWAADAGDASAATESSLIAKAYCSAAAREICQINIQVHGGIGNTWECMAHVHLRRVVLVSALLGDDVDMLDEIAELRTGVH